MAKGDLLHMVAAVGSYCCRCINRIHILCTRSSLEKKNVHPDEFAHAQEVGTDRRACTQERSGSDGAGSRESMSKSMN